MQLARLSPQWNALAASGSPMQHHSWALACAETLLAPGSLRIVSAGPAEAPRALAGLVDRGRHLELLGARELGEPGDLVYADAGALRELVAALRRLPKPVRLQRLPAASPTLAAIRRSPGVVMARDALPWPGIDLDAAWTEPEAGLSSRRRSDIRRARRRAEGIGEIAFTVHAPAAGEEASLLDEAIRVEAAGWKTRAGSALALDGVRGRFFRRWATLAAAEGILRILLLRIGGEPAAMQLAAQAGGRLWLLKIGFDERFARCSPGLLLMVESLRWAAQRQLEGYELLGQAEPWTQAWTKEHRPCASVRAYPRRARGLAALTADAAAHAACRMRRGDRE